MSLENLAKCKTEQSKTTLSGRENEGCGPLGGQCWTAREPSAKFMRHNR